MTVTKEALEALALSEAEYEAIVERLGREPNDLELGLFGSLWSEHCGYKHSKPLLRTFSVDSPRLLARPGEENAGVVDIGDGLAAVFKIESHNHPSAIEPYQGAATGVGGIVRDILAMGARPMALLNSLRFGPLDDPASRYLFEGVVAGISGYGNCIGVPDVGGEVVFSPSYAANPLVNAMCVGLLRVDSLVHATTGGAGNLLMLVGADTGRDGIHGASGLASRTFEEERELRPTVQVGNPFLEKVLIEACLEGGAERARGRHPGPRGSGSDQRKRGDGVEGRARHRDRRIAGAQEGHRHDSLRGDALGVAGADARYSRGGPRGGAEGRLRQVGHRLDRHRQGDRRRGCQDLRGGLSAGRRRRCGC